MSSRAYIRVVYCVCYSSTYRVLLVDHDVWSLIIRSADVFHPIRPFRLHQQWALRIDKEFAQQAKLESVRR
eukprot:5477391-Pyramimonas_sp.AAC.1